MTRSCGVTRAHEVLHLFWKKKKTWTEGIGCLGSAAFGGRKNENPLEKGSVEIQVEDIYSGQGMRIEAWGKYS